MISALLAAETVRVGYNSQNYAIGKTAETTRLA
jgi:hypothetical protein